MSLIDWSRNGWLVPHRTSPGEIADLLAVVERDLADSASFSAVHERPNDVRRQGLQSFAGGPTSHDNSSGLNKASRY